MSTNSSNPYLAPQDSTNLPQNPWGPLGEFQDLRFRSYFVAVMGSALAFSQLLLAEAYFRASQEAALAPPYERGIIYLELVLSPVWLGHFGLAILTGMSYLLWIAGAYKNLPALGCRRLSTPIWMVVLGYLIPFLNLVQPYMVLQEIWVGSDPEQIPMPGQPNQNRKSILLAIAWWGLVILSVAVFLWGITKNKTGPNSNELDVQPLIRLLATLPTAFHVAIALIISSKQWQRHIVLVFNPPIAVNPRQNAYQEFLATVDVDVPSTTALEVFDESGSDRRGATEELSDLPRLENVEVLDDPVEPAEEPPSHAQRKPQMQRQTPPKQTPGTTDIWDNWPGQS